MNHTASLYHAFKDRRYFSGLDGLRCLAIFGVLFHHAPLPAFLPDHFFRGYLGVDLFFLLSGFLIVTLLLREKTKKGKISLKQFYVRKALRILPVYYGILLVLSGFYALKPGSSEATLFFELLPSYLAFVMNWKLTYILTLGVVWALCAEVQFYLVWPLVEAYVAVPLKFILLGLFTLLNIATSCGLLTPFWQGLYGAGFDGNLQMLQTTFTPICFGIVLAHLLHQQTTFEWFSRCLAHRWTSTALLALVGVLALFSPESIAEGGLFRLLTHIAMFFWLASLLVREHTPVHHVLDQKLLAKVGIISYGIYLYHAFAYYAAMGVAARVNLDSLGYFLVVWLLGSFLSISLAVVSFYVYEKPILALKKKLM